jgi:hypothetical protein
MMAQAPVAVNQDVSFAESGQAEFDVVLAEARKGFRNVRLALEGRKELVLMIGRAIRQYMGDIVKEEETCSQVKKYLSDEIAGRLISERLIERYCLKGWKSAKAASIGRKGGYGQSKKLTIAAKISAEPDMNSGVPKSEHQKFAQAEDAISTKSVTHLVTVPEKGPRNSDDLTATIKRTSVPQEMLKSKVIRELMEENEKVHQLLAHYSLRKASELHEDAQFWRDKAIKQGEMLQPFEVPVELEYEGKRIPLLVTVYPERKAVQFAIAMKTRKGSS